MVCRLRRACVMKLSCDAKTIRWTPIRTLICERVVRQPPSGFDVSLNETMNLTIWSGASWQRTFRDRSTTRKCLEVNQSQFENALQRFCMPRRKALPTPHFHSPDSGVTSHETREHSGLIGLAGDDAQNGWILARGAHAWSSKASLILRLVTMWIRSTHRSV